MREDLVVVGHRDEPAEVMVRNRSTLESIRSGFALRAWQQAGGDHDGDGSLGVV